MQESYQTKSPVLFLIFNRPDITKLVFEQIKQAKPGKLYIAADGPRKGREKEDALCMQSREILKHINWDCEVTTLLRQDNLGCKYAVSSAIDWFFENEAEGIILEDDCLPNSDFFVFCDLMLEKYRDDTRIRHIAGCNLHGGKKWGTRTYYFSNNTHVWGWASWRRVWNDYNVELNSYSSNEVKDQFGKIFHEELLVESWVDIFKRLKLGEIDTWDYQLGITNFFNNGLCIIPNVNLISNIGFRADGTHITNPNDRLANIPLEKLTLEISHPKYVLPEKLADQELLYRDFDVEQRLKKEKRFRARFKRFLNKVRSRLPFKVF